MSASLEPPSGAGSRPLPTGTVTFLFTDIESSTQHWERDRVAMRDAVRRHDDLVRRAIVAGDGHVFKTIGDEFCAAFARPEDAVAAAAAAQRVLSTEEFEALGGLAVRMAIHTGTADERDGDYFGPAVNRVARILSVGHGGQILVSGVTADLTIAQLPHNATLRDLGQHRLRDLERPEQIYQLTLRDLRSEFPALRSLDYLPNNLPAQLTPLIGRDEQVDEITTLLGTYRVVTIVGSGGIGKTRASLQVSANLLDSFAAGVWFAELAPVSEPDLVPTAVATAMGLTLTGDDHLKALPAAIGDTHVLLVLDNCEHLVDTVAQVVAAIARRCPHAKILASSRQPLGIDGEAPYRMPPLSLPPAIENLRVDEALKYGAIELFCERARIADRRFALTDVNVAAVADICRRLDGIPLAIELAAARTTMLSPVQLLARLDERFRLLTGTSRSALPRQQTLRAMIDWSYELLTERERLLFDRLGIFVGSCTLDAATLVCSAPGLDELDIFDVLAALIDKSMVITEADDVGRRYRMLDSMRAYAADRLAKRGERAILAQRHLSYYCSLAVSARKAYDDSRRETDLGPIIEELDNLRAAVEWSLEDSDGFQTGAQLAGYVPWGLWSQREAYERLRPFSEREIDDPCVAAQLWSQLRIARFNLGDQVGAREASLTALRFAERCGDREMLFLALTQRAQSEARDRNANEATRLIEQARPLVTDRSSPGLRWRLLFVEAYAAHNRGDFQLSATLYRQLLAMNRSTGNPAVEPVILTNLADAEYGAGNYEDAVAFAQENLRLTEGRRQVEAGLSVTPQLCAYLIALDRCAEARDVGRSAARLRADDVNDVPTALLVSQIAVACAIEGDLDTAAVLSAFAKHTLTRADYVEEITVAISRDRLESLLRSMEPDQRRRLTERGAAMSSSEALKLAFP